MYMVDNMFQQMHLYHNGKKISAVDDYIPQVAALKNRLSSSEDSQKQRDRYGNFSDPSFYKRLNLVVADGAGSPEYTEEAIKPSVNAASTVAVVAATGVVTGVNTQFTQSMRLGDILEIGGERYPVIAGPATDTSLTVRFPLSADIGATANWRRIRIPSKRKDELELIWRPPLGWWDISSRMSGDFKLVLFPHTSSVPLYLQLGRRRLISRSRCFRCNFTCIE
jgi:hypothetical protein